MASFIIARKCVCIHYSAEIRQFSIYLSKSAAIKINVFAFSNLVFLFLECFAGAQKIRFPTNAGKRIIYN